MYIVSEHKINSIPYKFNSWFYSFPVEKQMYLPQAVNNKLFSINLLEKPKTVYIRTYMTQRFTAYLARMRQIQRADYSTTMHNSDRIFIAAWAAH